MLQLKTNIQTPVKQITMKMIKQVTTTKVVVTTKTPHIMATIMKKEHIRQKPVKFIMDTTTIKVIGLTLVIRLMIKVSIKDIGMRITNGLTRVVKLKITTTKEMTLNLTII